MKTKETLLQERLDEISKGNTTQIQFCYDAIFKAMEDYAQQVKNLDIKSIPYQKCPLCDGSGQVFVNQIEQLDTTNIIHYKQCHVCGGSGIIPMH